MNNDVLDLIIILVKACKHSKDGYDAVIETKCKDESLVVWNADYLLNQTLRQLDIPKERCFVSKKANEVWNDLDISGKKGKDINDYFYQEKLKIGKTSDKMLNLYSGASKTPSKTIDPVVGTEFRFREVFHLEHIIPVTVVIKKLLELSEEQLTYENVNNIINKICVCRMLKEEDHQIEGKYKSNREFDFDWVINNVYKPNIEILKD